MMGRCPFLKKKCTLNLTYFESVVSEITTNKNNVLSFKYCYNRYLFPFPKYPRAEDILCLFMYTNSEK